MKTLLLSALIAVTACTTPKEPVRSPAKSTDTVKPGAPTMVDKIQLADRSGLIEVHFEGAGENVSVNVAAIDGLTLTSSAEVHSGRAVKAGDTLPVAVTFERGAGRGQLVITVNGTFNGAFQSRVHTVAVGEGPLKNDGAKVQVTTDGDAVKLMP